MSMSKRNIIWLLTAFFFIADLAAAVHKGKKEVCFLSNANPAYYIEISLGGSYLGMQLYSFCLYWIH